MSIRLRLFLSYIAMLVIPVVLTLVVAIVFFNLNNKVFLPGGEKNILEEGAALFADIQYTATKDPDRFKSADYLAQLDQKLAFLNTGIVLQENNQTVFVSKNLNVDTVSRALERSETYPGNEPRMIDNQLFMIQKQDFHFTNGASGRIYMLINVGPLGSFARHFLLTMVVAVLLILIHTNGILTFMISRSIIKPLKSLKKATERIKEGDLDFAIQATSRDEIGQLAVSFEEMRHRLKDSLEQQEQYEKNRKELISSISHDLKTPITAIKGYVEGIMDGVADTPEKMDRYIRTIYTKANDLDQLIEQLFHFSKLDLKKIPFHFENVDLYQYLSDSAEELKFDLALKNITLKYEPAISEEMIVSADREELKRVITNIIENAAKYMDKPEGYIGLGYTVQRNTATVFIEDNGRGISPETLPHIFNLFYRADDSRSPSTGGSGLGLAIAKQIVEEHGGRIWAESIEGKGTKISFTLQRVGRNEDGREEENLNH